ncbi:APSES transcription factor [Blastomyces dermatitidis ER-3]|uniref:Cell pattern formation-associated protein stuA n=2 Tax=Ajellomyces dermatitidis TaxID=5039 RepID=F2TGF6_AJEDA|nr:APSES transcription factor [Blastomyces dermatitidis ER-3]EEQ88929.2 APSES transcription factor [Blastomyces dermatitidis ER-3]EGE82356.2 APSES transcription factor [Blastomyces dermatitidis ATCC 18188]EQL32769.1 hypothetical protein BDFG_05157 [Blastomyces dermatitidis ATCC 26199]
MRSLPKRINPLILPEVSPPYEDLLSRRRLGKTNLSVKPGQIGTSSATKPENLGMFEYAHLRAPLPKDLKGSEIFSSQAPQQNPEAYFLMRRSKDGYVSATGMFKIAFPWAKHSDEKTEREYLKSRTETSEDEVAGNVWISPDLALEIAKDYGMFDWVRALLDPTEIVQNGTSPEKHISPPPKFELPPIDSSAFAPPQPIARRTRRSVSPSKMASPKKSTAGRKLRQTRAQKEAASAASSTAANASLQSTLDAAASTVSTTSSASEDKLQQTNGAEEPTSRVHGEEEEDQESKYEIPVKKSKDRAHHIVNKSVKAMEATVEYAVGGKEDRVETRRVDLAPRILPEVNPAEDSERMLAEAKKMVADAANLENNKNGEEEEEQKAEPSSSPSSPSKKRGMAIRKRKAEEEASSAEEEGAEDSSDAAAASEQDATPAQPAKRARLLEDKLRRERVRNRALVGVTATLALAAAIPYFF